MRMQINEDIADAAESNYLQKAKRSKKRGKSLLFLATNIY